MSITQNLITIRREIDQAAKAAGRDPEDIKLVAVSKTKPAEAVLEALQAGQMVFGENYVQESAEKIPRVNLAQPAVQPCWHYIGHLQSNKAKLAAELFHAVHTVDRLKLAKALGRHALGFNKTLEVLLQVNVAGEEQKSGCSPEDAARLAEEVAGVEGISLKGLMTMPPFLPADEVRPYFARLREISEKLAPNLPDGAMSELSMGMSGDFTAAIAEGSTLVRVGTSIFGARNYNK